MALWDHFDWKCHGNESAALTHTFLSLLFFFSIHMYNEESILQIFCCRWAKMWGLPYFLLCPSVTCEEEMARWGHTPRSFPRRVQTTDTHTIYLALCKNKLSQRCYFAIYIFCYNFILAVHLNDRLPNTCKEVDSWGLDWGRWMKIRTTLLPVEQKTVGQ